MPFPSSTLLPSPALFPGDTPVTTTRAGNITATISTPGPIDNDDPVTITATITDYQGIPADPGALTFQARTPSGTNVDADTLTHDATGTYTATLTVDQPGVWSYRFQATTPNAATIERRFTVHDTAFAT